MHDAVTTTSRLLEREEPLAYLRTRAARAARGSGTIARLTAPAGLGKSSLLDAAAELFTHDGLVVLRARGSELERASPYGLVRQLLDHTLATHRHRAQILSGAAAPVAELLDAVHSLEPLAVDDLSPFRMQHALYWAIANLSHYGPLALLVDDAHDGDLASLRLMGYLARRIDELPVFVVIAARPRLHSVPNPGLDMLDAELRVPALSLVPLSPRAVGRLVERVTRLKPDARFSNACHAATGGNPFYVEELLRAAVELGLSPDAANADALSELGPPALVHSLRVRLAAMPGPVVPLVRACAVLGDGATLADCARLVDLPIEDAAAAADLLVGAGILANGEHLSFAHPILRAAVVTELGEHANGLWHARAARMLADAGAPPATVGLHLLHSPPGAEPWAADMLRQAGRAALNAGTPAAAVDFLRRAIAESPEPDADLLFDLGLAAASLGELTGVADLERSVELTTDPQLRAHRAAQLSYFQMRTGAIAAAVQSLGTAIDDVSGEPDLSLHLRGIRYWIGRMHPSTYSVVRSELAALREHADGPDTAARRELYCFLAADADQSETAEAASAWLDRALAPPGLAAFVSYDALSVGIAQLTLSDLERHDELDALTDEFLRAASEAGALLSYTVLSSYYALALLRRGDARTAEQVVADTLASRAMAGWTFGEPGMHAIRAEAALEQDRVDDAAAALRGALASPPTEDFSGALVMMARGRLRTATAQPAAALADLQRAGEILAGIEYVSPGLIPWRSAAAWAHLALGDRESARAAAELELGLARRLNGPIAEGRALRALAATVTDGERVEVLRDAVAALRRGRAGMERARALVDLGAALRRAGRPAEARAPLGEALELATLCGNLRLAEQTRGELSAAGARPRRVHVRGPDALTAGERRVVRLAQQGLSNTAIAQSLFVTRKTVEKHLANAYRKLGITSRSELARAMRGTGTDTPS